MDFRKFLPSNILPSFGKSQPTESFFALNIESDRVSGALWVLSGRKLQIINTAQSVYASPEELVETSIRVLDSALADYDFDPKEVLFGVPDSWLHDDNLKEEHLHVLRKLVKEVDLKPMAYVSTSHAISHLLQKQSGVPTTAILVSHSDPLTITVIKGGKVLGDRIVKRSDDLSLDIEKGLLGFDEVEVLPSRILLYGQGDLESVKEKLLSFPWMTKLPFLHLPKIDVLDKDITTQSICFAGACELEPDVSFHPTSNLEAGHKSGLLHHGSDLRDHDQRGNPRSKLETAGFVAGDIEDQVTDEFDREIPAELEAPPRHSGAPAGGIKSLIPANLGALIARPLNALEGVLGQGRGVPGTSNLQRNLIFILPVVLILGVLLSYLFLVKAQVTLFIDAKILEKEAQVIADPSISSVDQAAGKIPGKIVETSVTGNEKGAATGKKQIGDPAKGKVIIYNKTDSKRTFPAGTVLSNGSQKFTLDTSVQVASRSSEIGPGFSEVIKPGKSDSVGISASQIGPDGNLAAGTNLNVADFNQAQVIGQVDVALSGGTSKDISVVTADDQKKLLAQAASNLRRGAKDELQAKLTGDLKILEEALQENITKTTYSKAVGDQASDFTINLTVNYKGTAYADNDLKTMVSKLVETTVPEGFELNLADTETQATASRVEKDGKLIFTAKFKAKLSPKLDQEKLKKEISFKSPAQTADILKKIENVIGVNIKFSPNLPVFLQRLPLLTKNITLEVTAK